MTTLSLAAVVAENPVRRLDSTYFSKEGLAVEKMLRANKSETLASISESVLSFGAYALTNDFEYQETGIPFLRCVNIKDGFVSFSDSLYINNGAHELLKRSEVTPETDLLTMSGSVGNAAVALKSWPYPINSNQDIAKYVRRRRPISIRGVLGSRSGRQQMSRLPVGSIQQHIFIWMIEAMLVARIGAASESRISKVRKAYDLQRKAVRGLHDAELALISALGLGDWSPPEPLTMQQAPHQRRRLTGSMRNFFHHVTMTCSPASQQRSRRSDAVMSCPRMSAEISRSTRKRACRLSTQSTFALTVLT